MSSHVIEAQVAGINNMLTAYDNSDPDNSSFAEKNLDRGCRSCGPGQEVLHICLTQVLKLGMPEAIFCPFPCRDASLPALFAVSDYSFVTTHVARCLGSIVDPGRHLRLRTFPSGPRLACVHFACLQHDRFATARTVPPYCG
jgi:hypothetical protein